ncbi:MAG: metallopeptidase TldD-related protein [Actinomycetes bacterium]
MKKLNIQEAVEYAISKLGPEGGVVAGESNAANNLRWANSALTTNGDSRDETLSIAAFTSVTGGIGSSVASGQVRTQSDVDDLMAQSLLAAKAAGISEDAMALVDGPVHADYAAPPAALDLSQLAQLGPGLNVTFRDRSADFFGYAEQAQDTLYVATSAGTRMRFVQNTGRFEICAKSSERDRSAWSGQGGTTLQEVNVAAHSAEVLRKLDLQRNKISVEPGRHKVTLTSSATADLLIYLMWSAAARDAAEGRSAFSNPTGGTRVGERLSNRLISLFSDPHAAGIETIDHVVNLGTSSLSSTFDTGLSLPKSEIITDGVLTALGSSRHAADIAKLPFTPMADNVVFQDSAGHGSVDELAARMGDGLLVTCLWYIREVDPQNLLLTGLTRDGVYVVRDGKIAGASNNFRFNESPIEILSRITDAGAAQPCLPREWADWFSRAYVAPITVADFNLSTKSDAI